MNLQDAVEFTKAALASGRLKHEHVAWLVAFFQRASKLEDDGKAGARETIPALEKYIAAQPRTYHARGSGYYPTPSRYGSEENRMEGGPVDRRSKPLQTLQGYLAGEYVKSPLGNYVSCAMDLKPLAYGTKLRIPELEKKYGQPIEFRVVDTGGAFYGKGTARIDICTASKKDSVDATINGPLTLIVTP